MSDLITIAPLAPPPSANARPQAPAEPQRDPRAWATAKDFESFFVSQMLEQISTGIKTDGPFGGGHAEKIYRSMMNGEYAKAITQTGGIGLADTVYREILALQEGSRP
ncbi:MAG: rod-binding protein [Alphaproteobacteria bacterium]